MSTEPHLYADEKAHTNGYSNGAAIDFRTESEDSPAAPTLEDIETDFWQRESLQTIYTASLSRMCSPWAVLGYCAARALAQVRPSITLPDLIGGPGSLNWFGAIAAISGGGKSASSAVARALVPSPDVLQRNLGSGEGLVDAYEKEPGNKKTDKPPVLYESIMFLVDEIQSMGALGNRSGSHLMPNIRSAFSGDLLGTSNRNASSLHLEPHSYRLTLVVNVQPAKAGVLTDDEYGGTLQRFMWFPGQDSRIKPIRLETREALTALTLPSYSRWMRRRQLKIPDEAAEFIIAERAKNMAGDVDPLDGHGPFMREKFAFALAVLDGRDEMSSDDWRLSGIAMQVSEHTRGWVYDQLDAAQRVEAAKRGSLQGVSLSAANVAKADEDWKRTRRIENWILGKLKAEGMSGVKLVKAAANRDRHSVRPVLAMLLDRKIVDTIDDIWSLAE
jgi:hypothetical protein